MHAADDIFVSHVQFFCYFFFGIGLYSNIQVQYNNLLFDRGHVIVNYFFVDKSDTLTNLEWHV